MCQIMVTWHRVLYIYLYDTFIRGWLFSVQFGFYKKKLIKSKLFKIKNRNRTKTGSNRPVSVWFFRTKPVQSGLARFFRFGSVCFCLVLIFSVSGL